MNNKVDYLHNPWAPVKQSIFKYKDQSALVDNQGYIVRPVITQEAVAELQELFSSEHNLSTDAGGMFYSVYSQNIDYRKRIHAKIGEILNPILESMFENYRVVLNSFVVKAAGPKSEFYVHQDTTGLDEFEYSPLNLWIPLQNVDMQNGCLGVVPHSHKFFTPYRSISFPAPFDEIGSTVRKYLHPIAMKSGDALIFDNRLVHHSYPNLSGETRVAVVCGLFPKEAKLQTCFKPKYELGGSVEIIEHEDAFLIENPNFLIECQDRPKTGRSIGFRDDKYLAISPEDFEVLCERNGVEPFTQEAQSSQTDCHLIQEPV